MKNKSWLPVLSLGIGLTAIFPGTAYGDTGSILKIAGYAGSDECRSCHEDSHPGIVRKWLASPHQRTMESGPGKKEILRKWKIGLSAVGKEVVAVIGGEDSGYVFVGHDFQVFPPEGLGLTDSFPPHDRIGNPGKKADAGQSCFGCHATGYFVSAKKYVEPGVACEACHGPGRKHIDSGGAQGTIVNPARLVPHRNRMVCGQCHSLGKDPSGRHPFPVMGEGGPFQPGDDLALGFVDSRPIVSTKGGEYSTFIRSPKPYSDQLCTDCHEPHGGSGNPSMLIDSTSALCLRCHGDPLSDVARVDEESHWGAHRHTCWSCHDYVHLH